MSEMNDTPPTVYRIHQVGERPIRVFTSDGTPRFSRILRIIPPPEDFEMVHARRIDARNGTRTEKITKDVLEVSVGGHTVDSENKLELTIASIGKLLNAATDPAGFVQVAYPETGIYSNDASTDD